MWATRKKEGFTIVELLIVVVVIGILAAIVIVAYNGITASANKVAITSELKQWHKLFQLYHAQYGQYPKPSATPTTGGGPGANIDDGYCLGTGFPQSGGTKYCYAYSNTPWQVAESTGAILLTELSKVGTPPKDSAKYVYGNVVGPLLRWLSDSDIRLYSVYAPGTDCGSMGLSTGYGGDTRQECFIRLD